MIFPKINVPSSGFMTCNLLGKAEIITSFFKSGRKFFIVEATTPVEKHLVSTEMYEKRVKIVDTDIGEQGYLVYFGTNIEGWLELIPFNDERFYKYEKELMAEIDRNM